MECSPRHHRTLYHPIPAFPFKNSCASGGSRAATQSLILEHIFVTYARMIKKCPRSALMPLALRGVAKFAHQVNVELLLDLFANLRAMLRDASALSPAAALHCVHALLKLLSGHGQARLRT